MPPRAGSGGMDRGGWAQPTKMPVLPILLKLWQNVYPIVYIVFFVCFKEFS